MNKKKKVGEEKKYLFIIVFLTGFINDTVLSGIAVFFLHLGKQLTLFSGLIAVLICTVVTIIQLWDMSTWNGNPDDCCEMP